MDSTTSKRFLPWFVAIALFMQQLDSTIVNTGIPAIAASLGTTPLALKAVVTSYILSLAVCIPLSGWLTERGSRRVFLLALTTFLLSLIACGLAVNANMLIAAHIPQGVSPAMMIAGRALGDRAQLSQRRTAARDELRHHSLSARSAAAIGLLMGFFNSLQYYSMNSMAFADIDDAAMASTMTSTMQQLSMCFRLACGSLVTGFYLAGLPQTDSVAIATALHYAFLILAALTVVSALSFCGLRSDDCESVSRGST